MHLSLDNLNKMHKYYLSGHAVWCHGMSIVFTYKKLKNTANQPFTNNICCGRHVAIWGQWSSDRGQVAQRPNIMFLYVSFHTIRWQYNLTVTNRQHKFTGTRIQIYLWQFRHPHTNFSKGNINIEPRHFSNCVSSLRMAI